MADVELNSIGNGDGNNYLVRDNTKIPLAGSNQISGSLIPATTDAYDLGGSSYQWNNAYIKSLTINGVACGDILTHNANEFMPVSSGVVITGDGLYRNTNSQTLHVSGGTSWDQGGAIVLRGNSYPYPNESGAAYIQCHSLSESRAMSLFPSGTWTWDGSAVQLVSDQRLKQQIAEIDDKLLDAWEDVELSQFKYNDAVTQKGKDKARLHTGYVVQQIDKVCKSHGVDVSKYGLYCHEEYAEETREVEHEDGTKTIEVVRPASEHYSLRYTEALIVECAYLRKKNKDLQEQLNALSERLDKLENR